MSKDAAWLQPITKDDPRAWGDTQSHQSPTLATVSNGAVNGLLTPEELRQAHWIDYTSPSSIYALLGILITLAGTILMLLTPYLPDHGKAIAVLVGGIIVAALSAMQMWVQSWKTTRAASGMFIVGRAVGKLNQGQ